MVDPYTFSMAHNWSSLWFLKIKKLIFFYFLSNPIQTIVIMFLGCYRVLGMVREWQKVPFSCKVYPIFKNQDILFMPRCAYLFKTYIRRKKRYFIVSKNRFPKVAELLYILYVCTARAAFAFPSRRKQLKELRPKYGLWYFPFLSTLQQ